VEWNVWILWTGMCDVVREKCVSTRGERALGADPEDEQWGGSGSWPWR